MDIREMRCGDYYAAVNLSRGANCVRLRNTRYDAILLREPDYTKELDNPFLYGMPILFPVNRISGGCFTFEGRIYRFPVNEPNTGCHLHGMLHEMPFRLLEHSEDRLLCAYRATEEAPYGAFPHAFEIMIEYSLKSDGLSMCTSVTNLSDENMPVLLGFHTTFLPAFTKNSQQENIRVYAALSEEYERNMSNYLPTGRKPAFDAVGEALNRGAFRPYGTPTSRHFRAKTAGRMVIYDEGQDLSLVYENDAKLGFRLIYNGNADEYICMEPQTCLANAPNSPVSREEAGFDFLMPQEVRAYRSRIYLADGDHRGTNDQHEEG